MRTDYLYKKYRKIKYRYWVSVDKIGRGRHPITYWKFQKKKPTQVANCTMEWQRPTFEEFNQLCKKLPVDPQKGICFYGIPVIKHDNWSGYEKSCDKVYLRYSA